MLRIEIKRTSVKVFRTDYVALETDTQGKKIKGTGESVEKLVKTFKRKGVEIPPELNEKLSNTDYDLLQKTLNEAHENDMRPIINNDFEAAIDTLNGFHDKLHLVEISEELAVKIDQIFTVIKRKKRADLKKNSSNFSH